MGNALISGGQFGLEGGFDLGNALISGGQFGLEIGLYLCDALVRCRQFGLEIGLYLCDALVRCRQFGLEIGLYLCDALVDGGQLNAQVGLDLGQPHPGGQVAAEHLDLLLGQPFRNRLGHTHRHHVAHEPMGVKYQPLAHMPQHKRWPADGQERSERIIAAAVLLRGSPHEKSALVPGWGSGVSLPEVGAAG